MDDAARDEEDEGEDEDCDEMEDDEAWNIVDVMLLHRSSCAFQNCSIMRRMAR